MALTYLETQVEEVRRKAEAIRKQQVSRRREIDNDNTLNDSYKQELRAENTASTAAALKALRAQEDRIINDKIKDLERTLDSSMGHTAADIIAFRDAQDRAEALNERGDAEKVLARALRNNDKSLAHAVFRRALDAGWTTVTDQFTQEDPTITETVRDLTYLKAAQGQSMQRTMQYSTWGMD